MKRILTFFFTLVMICSSCLPVHAEYSFQQDAPAETSSATAAADEQNTSATENDSTEDTSAENGSTEDASTEDISPKDPSTYSARIASGATASYGIDGLKNAPDITAESALLMDAATGTILYGKDAESKQYPASITKVMTALLAIEKCKMDDIVTFSSQAVNGIEAGSSSAGINVGAKLTVEDTLYALMLVSANEAGAALAEHISGSDQEFAKLMNSRAKELGCTGTHFTNPHGLPDEEHYTTAHDMGLILRQAMRYDAFRKIAEADTYTLKKSDTLKNDLELWNHAKILRENSDYYYEPAKGAKTGYTQVAHNTLVTYAQKDNVELLCVVLKDYGADSSYHDTADLFDWGFKQVEGISPLSGFNLNNALSKTKAIPDAKLVSLKKLNCTFPEDFYLLVPKGFDSSALQSAFVYEEDIHTGSIGHIAISSGDVSITSVPVTYDKTSQAAKSYLSNGEASDDLETAPPDKNQFTPRKLLGYLLRVAIAFLLIFIIMNFIGRWQAEKRRQQRIKERKMKHASSETRNINRSTSKTSGKTPAKEGRRRRAGRRKK